MFNYGVFSGPNAGKYGPEKTLYLDTFEAVVKRSGKIEQDQKTLISAFV